MIEQVDIGNGDTVDVLFIETAGDGLWSNKKKKVEIYSIDFETQCRFGQRIRSINVRFNKKTWSVRRDGLIYSDKGFLEGVRQELQNMFPESDWSRLEYTEQGMQGKDFVSMETEF